VPKSSHSQPNILFFFPDQFRADMCSPYSDRFLSTPHLDAFASQGIVFDNAIATCPVCTPWRGMLMTGRYPTHSGVLFNFVDMSPQQNPNCLGDVFKRAGYATGYIGKWHLSAGGLKGNGLHEREEEAFQKRIADTGGNAEFTRPGPDRFGFDHWQSYNFHGSYNDYWWYEDQPIKQHASGFETDVQIDQAIQFMERQAGNENPFFLAVAPHPPHPPFDPASLPPGYLDRVPESIAWPPNVPSENPRDTLDMRGYLAMAQHIDDAFGRLLRFLDESGLAENTLVVFTSDHGEMHGSHGRLNKMVPYREAIHIPLIVRQPGTIPAGERSSALFGPMDFLPTLCAAAGLEAPAECEGRSLLPAMHGGDNEDDETALLLMNYTSHWDFLQTQTHWPEWRGVYSKHYTYVRWLDGREELFDNQQDPYQLHDLSNAPEATTTLEQYRQRLAALLEEAHDDFRPGTEYASWFNRDRELLQTALGPVSES